MLKETSVELNSIDKTLLKITLHFYGKTTKMPVHLIYELCNLNEETYTLGSMSCQ
jgi:hypothetical protein